MCIRKHAGNGRAEQGKIGRIGMRSRGGGMEGIARKTRENWNKSKRGRRAGYIKCMHGRKTLEREGEGKYNRKKKTRKIF